MLESKNTATPDDKISFDHGEVSLVNLTGFTVGRAECGLAGGGPPT